MKSKTNSDDLENVEKDFIDFIANKRDKDKLYIKNIYQELKADFNFQKRDYKKLIDQIYRLNKILYDFQDPSKQIEAYKYHELILLYRHLSYSYKLKSDSLDKPNYFKEANTNFRIGFVALKRFIYNTFFQKNISKDKNPLFSKTKLKNLDINVKNWSFGLALQHHKIADYLTDLIKENPVIVDYGCGLGYISFEIAKRLPKAKVYLVDIDSIVLEFTKYRFLKEGIETNTIPINSTENLYPELPEHNLCIATEIMEHLESPLIAFENIKKSLHNEGILFGNFSNHQDEEQHISCDLSDLREELNNSFNMINEMTWEFKK